MNIHTNRLSQASLFLFSLLLLPQSALAQAVGPSVILSDNATSVIVMIVAVIVGATLLTRMWLGVINNALIHHEPLSSIEARSPYLPRLRIVTGTVVSTVILIVLSQRILKHVTPFDILNSTQLIALFGTLATIGILLMFRWRSSRDYLFAVVVGSVLSFTLLGFQQSLFQSDLNRDPFVMALGIVCVMMLWRFLFGPWSPRVKATVLGTFLFWIALHLLFRENPEQRMAHVLAAGVALIPALIWCWLFLEYNRQRLALVFLMFFSGMLSTVPVLFYDLLVRGGIEFQFFVFRIVPENFNSVSNALVSGNILTDVRSIQTTLIATLISFLIVGFIEEGSKFWVLRKSGKQFFTSIDDVMQLAIIVAIGFAFAENIINPTYFLAFVQEYLMDSESPQWMAFLGNVLGRSVLTSMVHIISSAVMGYFLGMAIFAESYLSDDHKKGKVHVVAGTLHWLLRLPEKRVFRTQMILIGLAASTTLHGMFNFMVTLPEVLPGNPQTLADLIGPNAPAFLQYVSLLMVPSLFYVVGGFWLFTVLFYRQESMKQRGMLVVTDTFVKVNSQAA